MAEREETLPISERDDSAGPPLTCLVLIGQSFRPDQPVARLLPLSDASEVRIGRGEEDALSLERGVLRCSLADKTMSTEHARLRCFATPEGSWCVLEDLGSRNGCRVNGQAAKRQQLQPGDVIETGQTFWRLVQHPGEDAAELLELAYGPGAAVESTSSVSLAMLERIRQLGRVAPSTMPVILLGESGTGKEVMATALHERSGREGKLVALNCAAIPGTLIESELFGHCKGAFTGACSNKRGVVEEAERGTLFLDEIGDMSLEIQAKVLRLLQERSFVRVGETISRSVEVRFVAATNRDLEQMVRDGSFRGDLFARLDGIRLQLPALRERKEDLGLLLSSFLRRGGWRGEVSIEAYRALLAYDWPYNIRELEKATTAAITLAQGSSLLKLPHLPAALQARAPALAALTEERSATTTTGRRFTDEQLRATLVEALAAHEGNIAAVARELDTSRAQIHRWLERVALVPTAFRHRR